MKNKLNFGKSFLFLPLIFGAFVGITGCASSVSISETSLSMYIGDTQTITATSSDEDALVLFESSNTNVATVRGSGKSGKITARGKGECVITAYDDNGATTSCYVKVSAMNVSLSHSSKDVDLAYSNKFLLEATSEDDGEITWSSNNTEVATVSNDGEVTCLDTGNATISASRKGGKANCAVTVIDSYRPADYHIMSEGKNAAVIADPGVWYYWPNGGDKVGKSIYQNNGFTSTITTLASTQGVAYRYQPGGKDGTGLKTGDRYRISFKVMLNVDATLTGKKSVSVTANQWKDYSYSGTISDSEPFYFTVKNVTVPNGGLVVQVKDIVVGEDRAADFYNVGEGKNAVVTGDPGRWYYWPESGTTVTSAVYENATLKASISKLGSSGIYFRYQPNKTTAGETLKSGDKYTISIDITMNATGHIGGLGSSDVTTAGTFVTHTYTGTIGDTPYHFDIKGVTIPSSGTLDITAKNIVITKPEEVPPEPVGDVYTIGEGNNATCVANPGKWHFWQNAGAKVNNAKYDNGKITANISNLGTAAGVYFRYQIDKATDGTQIAVGDKYTIEFDITTNVVGTVTGRDTTKAVIETANEFVHYTYTGNVLASEPFFFTIHDFEMPATGGIDLEVKNIVITKYVPLPNQLATGTMADAIAAPGAWFYSVGNGDTIESITDTSGVITAKITALASDTGVNIYYQPNQVEVGDKYTLTLKTTMNTTGTIGGSATAIITTAGNEVDFVKSGIVNTTECVVLNIKDIAVPSDGLVVTVKKDNLTSLPQGQMAVVFADPGTWYYNSAKSASFNVVPRISNDWKNGTMSVDIAAIGSDHFYFRYQPGGSDGTGLVAGESYRLSFTAKVSKAYTLRFGSKGSATQECAANVETQCVYEGIVPSASGDIFVITLDKSLGSIACVISNILVERM